MFMRSNMVKVDSYSEGGVECTIFKSPDEKILRVLTTLSLDKYNGDRRVNKVVSMHDELFKSIKADGKKPSQWTEFIRKNAKSIINRVGQLNFGIDAILSERKVKLFINGNYCGTDSYLPTETDETIGDVIEVLKNGLKSFVKSFV